MACPIHVFRPPPLPEELWLWILRFSLRSHWCVPHHPAVQISVALRAGKHKPPDAWPRRAKWRRSVRDKWQDGGLARAVRRWRAVVAKWTAVAIVVWLAMLELDPSTSYTARVLWRQQTHMDSLLGEPGATAISAADDVVVDVGVVDDDVRTANQVGAPSHQTQRELGGRDGAAAGRSGLAPAPALFAATAPPPVSRPGQHEKEQDPVHISDL